MKPDETLFKDQLVSLNASGGFELTFGPTRRGETWRIDRMVTSGASTLEPSVNVYRNTVTRNARIDFTVFGNDDISETTTELRLYDNDRLIVVYAGGTSGAQMTYRLEGLVQWRV